MQNMINKLLYDIEQDYFIKILYACEAGSRSYGIESNDSDYDVRFIYIHRPEFYLSIDPVGTGKKRDVIEFPLRDSVDLNGWEATKALRLFRKSNPSLLEWLHARIVYCENFSTVEEMRELLPSIFEPKTCIFHYLNIAKSNFKKSLEENSANMKRFINVLRSILAAKWIKTYHEFPPINLNTLVKHLIIEGKLREDINQILTQKRLGNTVFNDANMEELHQFAKQEYKGLEAYAQSLHKKRHDCTAQLDSVFQTTLKRPGEQ